MPSAFVIPGAGEPSWDAFEATVDAFEANLGANWDLTPVWWSDRGQQLPRIRESLHRTYPPEPPIEDAPNNPTVGAEPEFPGEPKAIWRARAQLLDAFAGVLADALNYWGRREVIQEHVLGQLRDGDGDVPVIDVIAHSLGGLIAVDLAAEGKVSINTLVTFGTPVPAFYVLDPGRSGLPSYEPGRPITLTAVGKWTNLWNERDYVALLMKKLFALSSGVRIDDRPVHLENTGFEQSPSDAHLAYWELEQVHNEVRRAFS